MHARYGRCEQVCASGEHLVANQHPAHNDINKRMTQLKDMWARLKDLTAKRKVRLEDAYESQLVCECVKRLCIGSTMVMRAIQWLYGGYISDPGMFFYCSIMLMQMRLNLGCERRCRW